jgi:hypothetical protein
VGGDLDRTCEYLHGLASPRDKYHGLLHALGATERGTRRRPRRVGDCVEGDFVVVPAGVVHWEVVDPENDVRAVVVRFGNGTGPLVIEVDR